MSIIQFRGCIVNQRSDSGVEEIMIKQIKDPSKRKDEEENQFYIFKALRYRNAIQNLSFET